MAALRAHLAVVGDGEAVRLVAQPLQQVERARGGGQDDRLALPGQEELLALLGQAGQGQVVQAELVEDLAGRADLALAAVDDDEVGQAPAQLLGGSLLGGRGRAGSGGAAPPGGWRSRPGRTTSRMRKRRYSPVRGWPSSKTTMLPTVEVPWMVLMS